MHKYIISLLVLASHNDCANTNTRSPPLILTKFEDMYYQHENDTETNFTCEASGSPSPKILWEFDGYFNRGFHIIKTNGTSNLLTIGSNVGELGMFGTYKCLAENAYGKAFSEFEVLPAFFEVNTEKEQKTEILGHPLLLSCGDLNNIWCVPECKKTWYISRNQGRHEFQPLQETQRITININGDLFFSFTTIDDDDPAYRCVVSNPAIKGSARIKKEKLAKEVVLGLVDGLSGPNKTHGAYLVTNYTYSAYAGENVLLECTLYGTVEWKRELNTVVPLMESEKYTITNVGRRLIIKNVSREDESGYSCQAEYESGEIFSVHFQLLVDPPRTPPIFLDGKTLSKLNVFVGSDAVMNCHARDLANDYLRPQWYRNAETQSTFLASHSNLELSKDATELIIRNVKTSDTATFQCVVANNYGQVTGAGYLNVEAPKVRRHDTVMINYAVIVPVLLMCVVTVAAVIYAVIYLHRRHNLKSKLKEGEIMTAWKETMTGTGLLSDEGLRFLSSKLDAEWEIFATEMSFERATIDQIKSTFHGGDDKILGFLKLWRYRKKDVSLEEKQNMIIDALGKCDLNHIIRDIRVNNCYLIDSSLSGFQTSNVTGFDRNPSHTAEEFPLMEINEMKSSI